MATPALKSIPKKTLEKVIRECNLSALLSSDKGRTFFESHLISLPEFNKYWTFYNFVNEITWNPEDQEQLLVCVKECFEKHIAIGANSQDRIDRCLGDNNRTVVDKVSKAIHEKDIENLRTTFEDLQKSAFEYLNREVFGSLIKEFKSEYSSRKSSCDLL